MRTGQQGQEVLSHIFRGQRVSPLNLGLSDRWGRSRTSFHSLGCDGDFVQTSGRERQRAGLRVTRFASSSQDTLQQLALRELLCNYQQQQRGKWRRGPNFMSSGGRAPLPIPMSEIYDEVYLK